MSRPADPSRRAFLTGRPLASAAAPRLGPAPPWLGDRISVDICAACARPCVEACPERIVAIHPPDHPERGLAFLDFRRGACTFCGACVEACPSGSGESVATGRPLPAVALDEERCLAARGVVCVICVARCPERALAGDAGGLVRVATAACTGCGACVASCPTEALAIPCAGTG